VKVWGLVGRGNVNAFDRLYVCHRAYHLFGRHVYRPFCRPSYHLSSRAPCCLDNGPCPGRGLCNDRDPCHRTLSWKSFGSYAWSATETGSDVKVSPSCLKSPENMTYLCEAYLKMNRGANVKIEGEQGRNPEKHSKDRHVSIT
jgi:hypothetical protein